MTVADRRVEIVSYLSSPHQDGGRSDLKAAQGTCKNERKFHFKRLPIAQNALSYGNPTWRWPDLNVLMKGGSPGKTKKRTSAMTFKKQNAVEESLEDKIGYHRHRFIYVLPMDVCTGDWEFAWSICERDLKSPVKACERWKEETFIFISHITWTY